MYRYYSKPINGNRITVVGEYQDGILKLATACCSKKDQFMRKKGRSIAEGRLAKNKIMDIISLDYCSGNDFVDFAQALSMKVAATKIVVSDI
jgi:hypothetical protein